MEGVNNKKYTLDDLESSLKTEIDKISSVLKDYELSDNDTKQLKSMKAVLKHDLSKVRKLKGYNSTIGAWSLQEIGDHFGITRERVRQIEKSALRKLSHPKFARQLRQYLDMGEGVVSHKYIGSDK